MPGRVWLSGVSGVGFVSSEWPRRARATFEVRAVVCPNCGGHQLHNWPGERGEHWCFFFLFVFSLAVFLCSSNFGEPWLSTRSVLWCV